MHPKSINNNSLQEKIYNQNFIDPEMIEAAFNFWFVDNQHVRSPFPQYIQKGLKLEAANKFLYWAGRISEQAKKEINDEILAEKFEEIIFETALGMALTEDERLTINYPFMPRVGDELQQNDQQGITTTSTITERIYFKKDDEAFIKIKLKNNVNGDEWETDFELPE